MNRSSNLHKDKTHTYIYTMGLDKNQNAGPYSNNGYRKDTTVSHLDFMEGEEVEFVGQSEKTKNKRGIPNGSIGIVLDKSIMKNKHMKTSRSQLYVDFGKYGKRIVRKELVRFPDDHEDQVNDSIDMQGSMQGFQNYVDEMIRKEKNRQRDELLFVANEGETVSIDKVKEFNKQVNTIYKQMNDKAEKLKTLKQDKINKTLDNRDNRKKYREWRKEFLDQKYLDLKTKVHELHSSSEYKQKRELRKKLTDEIEAITDQYTPGNESLTKAEFIKNFDSETSKDPEKLYHYQKDKDVVKLKYLKNELHKVQLYLNTSSTKVQKYVNYMNSTSRQYIPEVSDRTDYLKYLHYHYEGGTEYKYEHPKPSREYKVDSNVSFEKDKDIKLFQWGLNPQDVC